MADSALSLRERRMGSDKFGLIPRCLSWWAAGRLSYERLGYYSSWSSWTHRSILPTHMIREERDGQKARRPLPLGCDAA